MKIVVITILVLTIAFSAYFFIRKTNGGQNSLPETVSYSFHIRPVLSDKCFKCHGPDLATQQAGLRLDLAEAAYAPLPENPGAFAIVPGKPEESELMKRISSEDSTFIMPVPESHLGPLSDYEIRLFEKWIRQGAKYEKHWAFIKPVKSSLPKVDDKEWVRNEIDYFVLHKLDQVGLSPNEDAEKAYLLKRASFDLTGLPPSDDLYNQFMKDDSEGAFEKVIDQLLRSPRYGEKMAVHWLDVARYSDSYGYQDDNVRTQWPWRDWVIHAFNKNMPYDQFITWQIAGDMLPEPSKEQVLATAFLRNHKYTEEGGVIPEEYRVEYILDKTKTFSKGVLGLTVECAQCHDHKYDPVSQKEYFEMYAFFNNTKEVGYEGDVSVSKPAKNPMMSITKEDLAGVLSFLNRRDTAAMTVSVMGELEDSTRKTFVLDRGVYDQPRDEVRPRGLKSVLPYDTTRFEPNRSGLAKWTVDRDNPLTARVFVNQVWQEIFGRGLVKTSGDFGMQGELPSHPELLDFLAVDFMENNWDIKRLLKKIMLSSTYRQSAKVREKSLKKDPENKYLSRSPRTRLKAEFIRDMVLESSGLLIGTIGGPSVKPYQPKGLWEAATSGRGELNVYRQDKDSSLYRRGMYTFIKLTVPPPSMMIFDASNRDQCEVSRLQTNTPLQALVMMNDPTVLEASRVLAQKLSISEKDDMENIRTAFRKIICRSPGEKEFKVLEDYYTDQLAMFKTNKLDARKTLDAGEYPHPANLDPARAAALMKVIHTIYNMEEAITKS